MKNIPNAMKFSASLLIINMIFETADLGSKLKAWAHLISKLNAPDFFEIWQSEQIEHANYEYINCNWWPWPKIPKLKNLSCQNLTFVFTHLLNQLVCGLRRLVVSQKRSIIDIWKDRKSAYVIYFLFSTFNYPWCNYLISSFNYF